MTYRLGILISHPIQYYAPWFRHLAKRMGIEVFYAHRQDAKGQSEAGFGVEFNWDIPLLEGYPYRWLKNVARRPGVGTFFGCDTPEIYEIVAKGRFDAFLIFGWNRWSSIQAIRACRQNGVPVLMRGDSHLGTPRSRLTSAAKYLPYRWFLPRLDAHLYVGKRNKAYLRHYGVPEDRLFFVPHFVDNDFFAQGVLKAESEGKPLKLREENNIPSDSIVFLFVGKLIPKKRPADFVQACLKVFRSPEGSRVHALILGDGPLRTSLETLAKSRQDHIHFAGFRNQSELPAFYRASNVLVLPSDGGETWGLVVNEAFACGIPAIVSEGVGCAPDLIDEGLTGYTFPVGDVETLNRRMLDLKSIWQVRPEKMRAALQSKVDCYSLEGSTAGLGRTLDAVVMRSETL